jgi:hypothetical protein
MGGGTPDNLRGVSFRASIYSQNPVKPQKYQKGIVVKLTSIDYSHSSNIIRSSGRAVSYVEDELSFQD